jgi:ferredoxin-NADP reductase
MIHSFVHTLRYEADGVLGIELRSIDGEPLPAFSAGSHVDLHLPGGVQRSYSLVNDPAERDRYVLAVLRDAKSRGGSKAVHELLRIGMPINLSEPRNNFPLHEDAPHSVLVSGGIGITPLLCMARRLRSLARSFEMIFCARSRRVAAFAAEVAALGVPVHWHFDDEAGAPPDLGALLSSRGGAGVASTHYYACGPSPMLDAFTAACDTLGYGNAHIERFSAAQPVEEIGSDRGFTVRLQRSGKEFAIAPGQSILTVLLDAGMQPSFSCQDGFCGSCETAILEGEPEHRDSVLSDAERASGKTMMICVSGSRGDRLVLDL